LGKNILIMEEDDIMNIMFKALRGSIQMVPANHANNQIQFAPDMQNPSEQWLITVTKVPA